MNQFCQQLFGPVMRTISYFAHVRTRRGLRDRCCLACAESRNPTIGCHTPSGMSALAEPTKRKKNKKKLVSYTPSLRLESIRRRCCTFVKPRIAKPSSGMHFIKCSAGMRLIKTGENMHIAVMSIQFHVMKLLDLYMEGGRMAVDRGCMYT